MSSSMNYASVVAVFTPKSSAFSPIVYKADVLLNEEEFLGEPQPDRDRARQFMSNDGETSQYIDIFAISGKRDFSIIDSPASDQLSKWAFTNPQPLFNLEFTYQRNDQNASDVITHFHKDCKILNHPARVLSNDIVLLKFNIKYGKIIPLNASGELIGS